MVKVPKGSPMKKQKKDIIRTCKLLLKKGEGRNADSSL